MATYAETGSGGKRRSWLKRRMPKTLFGRALAIFLTPLILMQAISTYVFYDRHWDTMVRRLATSLAGDIALIVTEIERDPRPVALARIDRLSRNHLGLIVTYRFGAILENRSILSLFDPTLRQMQHAMTEQVRRPFIVDTNADEQQIAITVQLSHGVLDVLAHEKRLYSSTTYIFVMWMLGSALVLFAIALVFMRNQIRPIRRLAIAARAFGLGREVPNFKPEGAHEVRQAAEAFQQMRARIRRQIKQRTDMLSGVSHDLRTPLTRMKLQLAMLGEGKAIQELQADVQDMERMVEGYLAFARGEGTEAAVTTDIKALITDFAMGERRGGVLLELEVTRDPIRPLEVKPQSIKRALANFVSNARRYAKTVRITLEASEDTYEILVDDDGPGIPEAERGHVFKPFYRGDPSRNLETGGIGLGLTIARDIVHSHGGEIGLEEAPLGGLRVRIRMPV